MTQKRLGYIDALRGLLILLVLIYHLNSGGEDKVIIIDLCWPFMMPGFFFISGFVSYKYQKTWDFKLFIHQIFHKFRCLVIPAVIFFMLYAICRGTNPFDFVYGFGGFWFTPELFKIFCIYYCCCLIFRHNSYKLDCALIVISCIGLLVSMLRSSVMDLPFVNIIIGHISNGKMFGYFALGYFAKKYQDVSDRIIKSDFLNTLAILIYTISWFLLLYCEIEVTYPIIGLAIRWVIAPYTGIFIIYSLFFRHRCFFDTNGRFSHICVVVGRNSLNIYMLHYFFLYIHGFSGIPFVRNIIFYCSNISLQFIGSAIIASMIICMCLLCSKIIQNSHFLDYWLLGGKAKNDSIEIRN